MILVRFTNSSSWLEVMFESLSDTVLFIVDEFIKDSNSTLLLFIRGRTFPPNTSSKEFTPNENSSD